MYFTLLVAGALLPGELAVALTASLHTPNLETRVSRASLNELVTLASADGAHLDWLARKLFGHPAPAPTAPYAYASLAGAASQAFVWHADPVHIEVARDHLIVQSLRTNMPTAEESKQLIAAANELASDSGCELVCVDQRWFLLCEREWQIDVRPLATAIEAPVAMPIGSDAAIWNRLHNEIQMAWYTHPVNEEREGKGERTINAIWLHGGGRWKPLSPVQFAQVQSDAPEWQGAARAAGARGLPSSAPVMDTALIVIESPLWSRQHKDWSAWLQEMTAIDKRLAVDTHDAVDLVFCGNTLRTFESRPSDRYKPWRRRSLAEALAE